MAELTPEEKQKIYLEEKERLDVQTKLANEKKALEDAKKQKDAKSLRVGCLVVIFVVVIGVIILGLLPPEKGAKKEAPNLNASARYSGTQIIITNSDSFNWDNLKIELNSGLLDSGYYYEGGTIKAGSTATIGLLNFAKSSGERLNPLLIKVRTAYISADTPSGRASYACQWN